MTTSNRAVMEAIYQRFADNWKAAGADRTKYCFGNEIFAPVEEPWVRLLVQFRSSDPATLGSVGNRRFSRTGSVFGLIRVMPGEAEGGLADLSNHFINIFEGSRFGPNDLTFGSSNSSPAGDVDNGSWYGMAVDIGFEYEERK